MRRGTLTAAALVTLAAVTAPPAPAHAASQAATAKQLRKQVKTLTRSRDMWKQRATDRADTIRELRDDNDQLHDENQTLYTENTQLTALGTGDLAQRVTALARAGRITELHRNVLEPIRVNWPCGSTLFQGRYSWSIDMVLSDTDFTGGEIVERNCGT